MKFKIGDKVRILPSAVNGGVSEHAVGKVGKIIEYRDAGGYFLVLMDKYTENNNPDLSWAVYSYQMEPAIKIGQQLLLWEWV